MKGIGTEVSVYAKRSYFQVRRYDLDEWNIDNYCRFSNLCFLSPGASDRSGAFYDPTKGKTARFYPGNIN